MYLVLWLIVFKCAFTTCFVFSLSWIASCLKCSIINKPALPLTITSSHSDQMDEIYAQILCKHCVWHELMSHTESQGCSTDTAWTDLAGQWGGAHSSPLSQPHLETHDSVWTDTHRETSWTRNVHQSDAAGTFFCLWLCQLWRWNKYRVKAKVPRCDSPPPQVKVPTEPVRASTDKTRLPSDCNTLENPQLITVVMTLKKR